MRKKKSLILMLSLIFVLSIVLTACGDSESTTSDADMENNEGDQVATDDESNEESNDETTGSSDEPKYGGDLVWGTIGAPTLFNSLYSTDTASAYVEDIVFNGMLVASENFEPEPRMAESWDVSDDGLTWTFYLKKGIKWHDGHEFTAEDVVFTFEIPLHPDYDGPRASSFEDIESVTALDDYTVQFQLKQVDASFIWTAGYNILPKHILGDVPIAELGEHPFNYEPIGTGPYKFETWEEGQYIRLVANDDFYLGRPYLDSITYKIVPDQNALVAQLRAGDVDMTGIPAAELETVKQWEQEGLLQISSTLALQYNYLGYNLRNELFQDVNVRQALTHAVDRQGLIDFVLNGDGQVAHAPTSPLSWAYNPDTPQFEYDPEKAKQMLAEAGWEPGADGILEKDGKRFSFTIKTNQGNKAREDIAVVLQQAFGEIGIEVDIQLVEWSAFLEQISAPNWDFDAIVLGWALGTDPDPTAIWHSKEIEAGLNRIAYSRPDLDELMELNTTIMDFEERQKVIWEIHDEIAKDQPYMFLYYPNSNQALPKNLKGYIHHPRFPQYRIFEWWLDE